MRITTKSRFAVTAMIDLALRAQAGPVPLGDIALRHHISLSYLEQLFSKLRQRGLVESTRGPGGGYSLGRPAQSISVADVIKAVDRESLEPEQRVGKTGEQDLAGALTLDLWSAMDNKMTEHMHAITLASLVSEQLAKGVVVETRRSKKGVYTQTTQPQVKTTAVNSVFSWGNALMAKS